MDPEQMAAHFGFEPDDDAEKKLAKCLAKFAEMPAAPDDDEPDEEEAVKKMADDLGVEEGPKKMTRMFAALRATRAPISDVAALRGQIHALSARLNSRDAADADAALHTFADDAIKAGRWDAGKRAELITFARADMKAAAKSLLPAGTVTLLGRLADPSKLDNNSHLASLRAETDGRGNQRSGQEFAEKVKAHMMSAGLKGSDGYTKATAEMAKAHPLLARAALGR